MDSAIEADAAKADGMRRAAAGKPDWWPALARAWALKFLDELPLGRAFKAEDMRAWAAERGFETPGDARAWGTIMRVLARDGKVASIGRVKSTVKTSHRGWRELWVRPAVDYDTFAQHCDQVQAPAGRRGAYGVDLSCEIASRTSGIIGYALTDSKQIGEAQHIVAISTDAHEEVVTKSVWQRMKERLGL